MAAPIELFKEPKEHHGWKPLWLFCRNLDPTSFFQEEAETLPHCHAVWKRWRGRVGKSWTHINISFTDFKPARNTWPSWSLLFLKAALTNSWWESWRWNLYLVISLQWKLKEFYFSFFEKKVFLFSNKPWLLTHFFVCWKIDICNLFYFYIWSL